MQAKVFHFYHSVILFQRKNYSKLLILSAEFFLYLELVVWKYMESDWMISEEENGIAVKKMISTKAVDIIVNNH